MSEAVADNVLLSYVEETTFGVKKTGSNLQKLRKTSESIKAQLGTIKSNEITGDRQVAGIKKTSQAASGSIGYELSYGTYDDLLRAVLMSAAWKAAETTIAAQTTIAAVASGNKFTDTGNGMANFDAGEWVKVSGFATAANNGFFRVESSLAGEITVSGGTLVNESATPAVTITQLTSITNGSTVSSFNFERSYTDIANDLMLYLGVMINSMTMTVVPEQIITGAFECMGTGYEALTASAGSGYVNKTTTDWMNAVDDVKGFLENQSAISVTQIDLSIANNLRKRNIIGALTTTSMGAGQFTLTGTLKAYYESNALFTKFLAQTATQIAIKIQDTAGNAYIIDMPAVKFSDGDRNATGKDTDIIASLPFVAYKSSFGHTLKICKSPAA